MSMVGLASVSNLITAFFFFNTILLIRNLHMWVRVLMKCYQEYGMTYSDSLDDSGISLGSKSTEVYCVVTVVICELTTFPL